MLKLNLKTLKTVWSQHCVIFTLKGPSVASAIGSAQLRLKLEK